MTTGITLDLSQDDPQQEEVEIVGDELAAHEALVADSQRQQAARTFDAAADTERLRLVNERARTDPAYAALADLVLRGVQRT